MSNNQMPVEPIKTAVMPISPEHKPPDYSQLHENRGNYYHRVWKTASQSTQSRILYFLLLLMFVLFISIPMLLSIIRVLLTNVQSISSS